MLEVVPGQGPTDAVESHAHEGEEDDRDRSL
jgi:hypothetical protein